MSQVAYIRDEIYKELIRKDLKPNDFVNEAAKEKLDRMKKLGGDKK